MVPAPGVEVRRVAAATLRPSELPMFALRRPAEAIEPATYDIREYAIAA
jgi:hypothetical protein